MKKPIHHRLLWALSLLFLLQAPALAGVFDDAFACVDDFDSNNSACVSTRNACYIGCGSSQNPSSCRTQCDQNFFTCLANASTGGPLGIPQGFSACLFDATYEEPMLQSEADYLFNICSNNCTAERNYCLWLGDQMSPTPANWDEDCYSMGIDCNVACFEIDGLTF